MPIIEAGFVNNKDGKANPSILLVYGPTLQVSIGHFTPETDASPVPKDNLSAHALVDTGAAASCIDITLAEKLELPVVDKMTISGASGANTHDVYMAQIQIPSLKFTEYGEFAGVNLAGGGQQHQALLGRTFLQDTIMIYDGFRGQVTITVA